MSDKSRRVFARLLIIAPAFVVVGCGESPPPPAPTTVAPVAPGKVDPGPPTAAQVKK
jgi:hypothetical protein